MLRHRTLAAVLVAAAVSGASAAPAAGQEPAGCTVAEAERVAKEGYARPEWRRSKVTPDSLDRELDEALDCLDGEDRKKAEDEVDEEREEFVLHRQYRRVAPFGGLSGEGYWLKWLAVPAWVVRAETRGHDGHRWRTVNGIGACGPYQILGMHGRPCPANSDKEKLEHHQIAAGLPRGSWAVGYSATEAQALYAPDVYWWEGVGASG